MWQIDKIFRNECTSPKKHKIIMKPQQPETAAASNFLESYGKVRKSLFCLPENEDVVDRTHPAELYQPTESKEAGNQRAP